MHKKKLGAMLLALFSFISCVTLSNFQSSKNIKLCENYSGLPTGQNKKRGMVFVAKGNFIFGNDQGHIDKDSGHFDLFPEEAGAHNADVDGFWIDVHEVTNAQFTQFVNETGYKTIAERAPKEEWFPENFPKEKMVAGSAVFLAPEHEVSDLSNINRWWTFVEGANWRHPFGPSSSIEKKMNHPVVHIAFEDAKAYAKWAGKDLPTEAQWEFAAKGGLKLKTYAWGDELRPQKMWMANTFQGQFPHKNSAEDGYIGTAPVGCYPPNNFGLYDVAGNVWEIVTDNYRPGHLGQEANNPIGPRKSFDPQEPYVAKHVIKGGSYLCAPGFCMRYRPSSRQAQDFTMGTSHIGFRTVINLSSFAHANL